jgi:hypothetical protein
VNEKEMDEEERVRCEWIRRSSSISTSFPAAFVAGIASVVSTGTDLSARQEYTCRTPRCP